LGLGCYRAARPPDITRFGVNLLLLVALISNPTRIEALDLKGVTLLLSGFADSPIWNVMWDGSALRVVAGLALIGALLYLVAFTFVPVGQMLGRAFEQHSHIVRAYSFNIAGSLTGVWLFNVLSWRSSPPTVWFVVVAALIAPLLRTRGRQGWICGGTDLNCASIRVAGTCARPADRLVTVSKAHAESVFRGK